MNGDQIILDTNVVSYLMKGGFLAEAYTPHVQGRLQAITFITVGEMYFGAEKGTGASRNERNSKQRCETLWLFLMTMKLRVVTEGSSRGNRNGVEPLRPMMHGLPHVPFGTACPW